MLQNRERITYLSIFDGRITKSVPEGTPGAVRREWTAAGKTGVKFELTYDTLSGSITDCMIRESQYGDTLGVFLVSGGEKYCLTINQNSAYFSSLAQKIIGLRKGGYNGGAVEISPYSFKNQQGKTVAGVTIINNGEKVRSPYYDFATKKNVGGFPEPRNPQMNKDEWKIYFLSVAIFLKNEIKLLEWAKTPSESTTTQSSTYQNDEVIAVDMFQDESPF